MADDNPDMEEIEAEEMEDLEVEDEIERAATKAPSNTSVKPPDPSKASVAPPEPSQMTMEPPELTAPPPASQASVPTEQSQVSVPANQSYASVVPGEKSNASVPPGKSQASVIAASEKSHASMPPGESAASVAAGGKSQASVPPGESAASFAAGGKSQASVPPANSYAAVVGGEKSQASVPPGESAASVAAAEKSQISVPSEPSYASATAGEKSTTSVAPEEVSQTHMEARLSAAAELQQSGSSVEQSAPTSTIPSKISQKEATQPEKSQMSARRSIDSDIFEGREEKSQVSIQRSELSLKGVELSQISLQSQITLKPTDVNLESVKSKIKGHIDTIDEDLMEIDEYSSDDVYTEEEPELEYEPPRYVEPLGQATAETLCKDDLKVWVLDKLYHEGNMSRYGGPGQPVQKKIGEGGLNTYEDYKWQLEKLYRQVPQDMSVGKVRSKPESQMYEDEHWVLGKMFRDLQEEDYGYQPKADKGESRLDLSEALELPPLQFPPEPAPCFRPSILGELQLDAPIDSETGERCTAKVMSPSGKVYEFSYAGIMAVSVASADNVASLQVMSPDDMRSTGANPQERCTSRPSTPNDLFAPPVISHKLEPPVGSRDPAGCKMVTNAGEGQCPNKARRDLSGNVQTFCDTARKVMAIYDAVTGCDSYPCNEGDKPETEHDNAEGEDGVWSWLCQLICSMTSSGDTGDTPIVSLTKDYPFVGSRQN